MSYESPIELYVHQLRIEQERTLESEVFKAIRGYDITVNKEQLIKALKYDRDQYQRGYNEGYDEGFDKGYDADKWISVNDGLPEKYKGVLTYNGAVHTDFICSTGTWYDSEGVTHWQPLPAPPTEKPYD